MEMSHYAKGGTNLSQQTNGLRFDIYERVHLPENTVGIRELNDIELTPEISVAAQGEQAVLQGHLLLSGSFTGVDEARSEETLTHRIPVEITLPMNRIEDVDNIRVDIESFDVDLLSDRSLNVTGVLSLEGIEMVSAADADWREEEEVVFSHRVEEAPPPKAEQPALHQEEAPTFEAPPPAAVSDAPEAVNEAPELAAAAVNAEAMNAEAMEFAGAADAAETAEAAANEALESAAAPDKKEIKIAFSGKSTEAAAQAPIGVNKIMSMANAGTGAAVPPTEKRQEPATGASASASALASDSAQRPEDADAKDQLEWKKLFLQTSAEEPSFRRVRMCIAQKEDTIETIADRYQKNARELMLYNQLHEEYLQEGQVVYIP
jgi:stage VI sporulation protein D